MADVRERIETATSAYSAGDIDGALIGLIDVWREVRAVELAEAIDRVAGARANPGKPLGPKTWHAMAARRDPLELDQLLATPLPRAYKPLAAALDALYEWDDDPRIARVLARFVADHVVAAPRGRALESRALARLARLRDVRVLPALRALRVFDSDVQRSLRLTVATLDKHAAKLPPEAIAALASITRTDATEAALLGEIARAPDDLAAYEIWSDWLAQHADPRGQLLALQLAGESKAAPPADARRIAALIAQHGERWAGAIGAYFKPATWRFERGLFAGGELVEGVDLEGAFDRGRLTDPAWAFVRVIRTKVTNALVQRLGARITAAAPAVREVGLISPAIAAELASPTLRELTVSNADEVQMRGDWFRANGADAPQADIDPRLAELAALPALERLVVYSRVTAAFAATAPVLGRLTSLVVRRAERDVLEALAARTDTPKLRELTVEVLSNLTLTRDGGQGPFTHATAQLTDARDIERIAGALERVPPSWLRSIVVTGDGDLHSYNDRELRMFEAAVSRLSPAPTIVVSWQRI